jgi:hypothetical protein
MTAEQTKPANLFVKGQSGNPKGRPRGKSDLANLRAQIANRVPEIINTLLTQSLAGDVAASRLLLERAVPPLKAIEQAQPINLPTTTLADAGRAIMAAVAAGELAPSQGAQLIGAVGNLGRVIELDELAGIVAALEARIAAMEGETK